MVEQLKKYVSNPDSLISLFLGLAVVIVIGVMIFNYVKSPKAPGISDAKSDAKQEQQATASAAALPASHTVATGESLWKIADQYYKSGYNWVDIRDANNLSSPNAIEVGQKLTIPQVSKREPGQIANATIEVKRPADGKYTVKQGDSLWNISMEVYGTGYRWTEIAKLNKLENPGLIFTGNVLNLP